MENLVKIFTENVARGNFVQIGPNFPAKSLKKFLDTLLIENTLLERILKQINASLNVTYWAKDKHFISGLFTNSRQ